MPTLYQDRRFHTSASEDNIRHFANGYGDDNPLWCDPGYAVGTMWGSVIAPPTFAPILAGPYPVEFSDTEKQTIRGDPMAGIGSYNAGSDWEFWSPIRPGERVQALTTLISVEEKRSGFANRAINAIYGTVFATDDGRPLTIRKPLYIYAERGASREKAQHMSIERTYYDDELLARMDAAYAAEVCRGADPRPWEEVRVGEAIPGIVRGPFLIADVIAWHMGYGPGTFGAIASSKLAYKNRQRIPKFYHRQEFGAWDSAMRLHWEDAWAQKVGHPFAFDYGLIRENWMLTAVTNWCGDNAWVARFNSSIRKFNYVGDTQWIDAKVVEKYERNSQCYVIIELVAVNQRDETTAHARADVILPRTKGEQIVLPGAPLAAPTNPLQLLKAVVIQAAQNGGTDASPGGP
jgi:acyl dehydratase